VKVVLLAGGYGTRLSEETEIKPKPMVEIGGKPILWHIMKIYSSYGFNDFIICLGYRGYAIKEYFANYFLHMADVTFDVGKNEMMVHNKHVEPWKVTLVDTGHKTMTGGRIKRVMGYTGMNTFMATYGDGVSNVDIGMLLQHHQASGRIATLTAVKPTGRFGSVDIGERDLIRSFVEKPQDSRTWINGGFFVFESEIFNHIEGDECSLEKQTLALLANKGQLISFKHEGFWKPMDTLRDKHELIELWTSGRAPWKNWNG